MLEKTYDPAAIEAELYPEWEQSGAFSPKLDGSTKPYTIMMPPPNVTGRLHIGHALNHTLQDILVRYHRMRGFDVLWQPGTDHAGIATQMVVERELDKKGLSRHNLGREKFLELVWQWKREYGDIIVKQLRRLGVSPDWSRERFTMDEGLNHAVRKVFVELHKQGLIYRDKRLVSWDPKLHTAVSDIEVQNVETKGSMWYFKYPIAELKGQFITIATTRPETMLGDTAIAVHPDDERYQHLIGKHAELPLVGRMIPIVADSYSDPEKGTGAVKITPAHDFNDFEVGTRHKLPAISIFDQNACLNDAVPERFRGMDRFKAREQVVIELETLGLMVKKEDILHMVPYCERTGEVVEPFLTDQWFADAATLAQPAIKAVKQGKMQFIPKNWENTYFEWLRNIQPWCISRQLWWGHRIPAWYGPDDKIFVAMDEAEANALAAQHYGKPVQLRQDEDVLDTWFSSALWPFSTLGWPQKTPELQLCYPGDVLITGHDIIFFWVARMMMLGLHFMGDIPFKKVCITALVRDEKGQKMSKSKGNVVDPLEFIDQYGADAVRFSLASLAGPGRDVNFSRSQVEGYRNFATKIWNAFRFCEHNGCDYDPAFDPAQAKEPVNRWIIGEVCKTGKQMAQQLDDYRFDEACSTIYHFVWGKFCDWYLEFTKPILAQGDTPTAEETRHVTAWVLSQILHLLHPFMPFVTEELWEHLAGKQAGRLITAQWPSYAKAATKPSIDQAAQKEIQWLMNLISQVRVVRSEVNVPQKAKISLRISKQRQQTTDRLQHYQDTIMKMARLAAIDLEQTINDMAEVGAVQILVEEDTFVLPLGDVINIEDEIKRLRSELSEAETEIKQLNDKLSNKEFVDRAPQEIVEKVLARRQAAELRRQKIMQALARLQ